MFGLQLVGIVWERLKGVAFSEAYVTGDGLLDHRILSYALPVSYGRTMMLALCWVKSAYLMLGSLTVDFYTMRPGATHY